TCIMVGIKGQTKEMINNDLKIVMHNFEHATINIFVNNSTQIKADPELIQWFKNEYEYLLKSKNLDLLLDNTDFGVGGPL
ncbi:MAG: radical SAM protein, partial [Candidatus Riflebacteria bacterium]|nr:radical SAM protein [Candidatus Riflebacteria bacterium]